MIGPVISIPLDLLTIARCSVAVIWGIVWALTLQYTKWGQFLAERRAWLAVVIGVGVDLIIMFTGDFTPLLVVACSSIGIIARSLNNEANGAQVPNGYKLLWGLEDGAALCGNAIEILQNALEQPDAGKIMSSVSRALAEMHMAHEVVRKARRGEYEQRSRKAAK